MPGAVSRAVVIQPQILYAIFGFRFLPYKTIEFVKEHFPPGGDAFPYQNHMFYSAGGRLVTIFEETQRVL